jgi:hypothetical protein
MRALQHIHNLVWCRAAALLKSFSLPGAEEGALPAHG